MNKKMEDLMKTIVVLGLLFAVMAGLMGCTSTDGNNANMRNTNTNTGYVTSNASPTPMATSSPMPYGNSAGNSFMNANRGSGTVNSNHGSNTSSNANAKKTP